MIVLIDDERTFKSSITTDYTLLKTLKEALEWLDSVDSDTVIDQLWFDHDLGLVDGVKETVIPIVRKLEERCFLGTAPVIHEVVVHTTNFVGGNEIQKSLERYYRTLRVAARDYLIVEQSERGYEDY